MMLPACAEPTTAPALPQPDKARLYGDPGLVPTREGERVRRELALAGELRRVIEERHDVLGAQVDVELSPAPLSGPPRVLISAAVAEKPDDSELEHYALEAAAAVIGPTAETTVLWHLAPEGPPQGPGPLPIPLALAVLGLGLSAGIALERVRSGKKRPRALFTR